MSEPVKLAKTAREHLATALNTLQSEADIPDALMDVADPIAEAMSILHRIERSSGVSLEGRTDALKKVRAAFDLLLDLAVSHPAIDAVTESVALSICKTAALVRSAPLQGARSSEPAPPVPPSAPTTMKPPGFSAAAPGPAHMPEPIAPAPQPVAVAPSPQPLPAVPMPQALPEVPSAPPLPIVPSLQAIAAASVPAPVVVAAPVAAPAPVAALTPSPQPLPTAPSPQPIAVAPTLQPVPVEPTSLAPPPQPAAAPPRDASPVPAASPVPEPGPTRQELERAAAARPLPAAPSAPDASAKRDLGPRPPAGTPSVDVDLGTHSPSNFYKGLGGNDVIEHGGIFVATYKIPKVGATVSLRVHLPGNYEFYANAVVQWVREAGGSIDSSEPGFGARFTQISPDGRQLVYRYTRNREPIFYDDL